MTLNVDQEMTALRRLTMRELRARFAELFGETTPAGNRLWLMRRIVWRLQALAEGDLSERARRRAADLANDADLRTLPPALPRQRDAGSNSTTLAAPGTVITRVYKGQTLQVRVLAKGFEFEGTTYPSLSAVARAITGTHWNGRLFFRLEGGGR
jgi:Protein of unknown function (DUF2924)